MSREPGAGGAPVAVYRWLLRLYPSRFRLRYGEEMADVFARDWADARGRERVRVAWRAVRDLGTSAYRERRYRRVGVRGEEGMTMGQWARDLRWALRGVRRRPGFHLLAAATIALGIGSASTVFAVVDTVVLRPLPYPDADRLVAMWTSFEGQGDFGLSMAEQYDFAEESRTLEALGSWGEGSATLTGVGDARSIVRVWTWGPLFDVVGGRTGLGRLPSVEDSESGAAAVAVVSHAFWTDVLGSDPAVVGRSLELDQELVEVIGVLDPGVRLPDSSPDVWQPLAVDRSDITDRSGHWLNGVGRLAPGATVTALQREIDATHTRWDVRWAGFHTPGRNGHSLEAQELHARYFGPLRTTGHLLLATVAVVLLLACANVAAMLLARGEAREGELSLMWAMGAGRARIVRRLVVESVVLAGIGGAAGVAVAALATRVLSGSEGTGLPRTETIGLDGRVLAFSFLVTLASAVVFGVLPALRSVRRLAPSGRGVRGPDRSLSRSLSTLVVGQVGLGVVLLTAAGLLAGTLSALATTDVGIEAEGRVTFQVSVTQADYPEIADIQDFWAQLTRDVSDQPSVESAAVVRSLPSRDELRREGVLLEAGADEAHPVAFGVTSAGAFEVLGVPTEAGRDFGSGDGPDAPLVGLVNEAAARALWPEGQAVGQRVYPLFLPDSVAPVTIVGVVGDIRAEGPRAPVTPELYLHYAQMSVLRGYVRTGVVVARTSGDPEAVVASVPGIVRAIDPRVAVTRLSTMETVAAAGLVRERFLAAVLGAFALIALALAAMGTYGVVGFSVARRAPEFGVRLALGASTREILIGVVRGASLMALSGVAIGVAAALLVAPALESLVFGVNVRDPSFTAKGATLMGVVVVVASLAPAVRASRQDPLKSLRDA